tara:strand:- start:978 stop:1202 length:225 start_codon:yes stop_codon:yes gene_type:complete
MIKYTRIIGWSVVITMCTSCVIEQEQNHFEVVNTAEDMIGWIVEDVANGRLDSTTADTYIDNLEGIIIDLRVTR